MASLEEEPPENLRETIRAAYRQQRLKALRGRIANVAAVVVSGSVALLTAVSFLLDLPISDNSSASLAAQVEKQSRRIDGLQDELRSAKAIVMSGTTAPEYAVLEERLRRVEQSQQRINEAILGSPEKAVEMPMLRRDLQEMKTTDAESTAAIRREIDRIYDLNKWLFGGLALSVLAIALSNLRKPGTREPPKLGSEA